MTNKNKTPNVPNLRFPRFNNEWQLKYISDFCICNPKSEPLNRNFVYIDLESVNKGLIVGSLKEIQKDDAPSRAQRVLKNNDILFQSVRPYQKNNLLFNQYISNVQYVASTGYIQIRTSEDVDFVYQLLNTNHFNNEVMLGVREQVILL